MRPGESSAAWVGVGPAFSVPFQPPAVNSVYLRDWGFLGRALAGTGQEVSMLITTTPYLEGKKIIKYYGLVTGVAIMGADIVKDFLAGIRNIVGGRSAAYEGELDRAKTTAVEEMAKQAEALGANAVVGVDLDYETISMGQGNMLMVSAAGTAVLTESE
jgi:uncharacterized protein YbjQ (UPF0145 family)